MVQEAYGSFSVDSIGKAISVGATGGSGRRG